ncbi:MAG TPA: arylsulfotransferase family protein, partial [Solirubrobacteraceae bacterium]|nr:arylsulfotransferase family protein [Solirubrobacteraceae bacterium]
MTYLPSAQRILRPLLAAALVLTTLALASTAQAAPVGAYTTKGTWHFHSAPNLHPPKLNVLQRKGGLANGDFLVANLPGADLGPMTGEGGPMILDNRARPVWVLGVGRKLEAADLQQETYEKCGAATCAQPVLVWWEGVNTTRGITLKGEVFVADESYRIIRTLKAASPWVISLHDASIVGHDMWVTVYRLVPHQNLKPYGGSHKGTVYDVGLQEYDLTTGKQVGQTWDALNPGHKANVPLSASETPVPHSGSWDAYHLNAVQALPDGNLLVSMRNTEAVYLLNPKSGTILWTLGGKHSTFKFGKGAAFHWQHDAQLVKPTTDGMGTDVKLTVFNDNCCEIKADGTFGSTSGPSEGTVLRLNTVKKSAKLVKAYRHQPSDLKAGFLGSMALLPNNNALVGWGSDFGPSTYFSEYTQSGKQIMDVQWPHKDQSYRALYAQTPSSGPCPTGDTTCWIGTPFYKPKGAVQKKTVYASWNGATQVAKWQVLAGSSAAHLKKVGSQASSGFETAIALKKSYGAYEVQALDAKG